MWNQAATMFSGSVNTTPARNVYPTTPGSTLGVGGGGGAAASPGTRGGGGNGNGNGAARMRGVLGQPLAWWVGMLAALLALMFVAKRAGQAAEFSNIRLSGYNILTITLAAVIGITALKVLLTRFRVPGLTPLIQAV